MKRMRQSVKVKLGWVKLIFTDVTKINVWKIVTADFMIWFYFSAEGHTLYGISCTYCYTIRPVVLLWYVCLSKDILRVYALKGGVQIRKECLL